MSCHDESSTVVFVNTLDVYPPKQSLTCKFTVKEGELQCFDESCWIGIFKVGWESSSDVLAKKCLPAMEDTESGVVLFSNSTEEITFEPDEIPEKNDEEFYQFCFITGKGAVLGASCPFQITDIKSNNGSLSGSLLDLSGNLSVDQKKDDVVELEWCPWFEVSGEDVDDTVFVHNKTTLLEKSLAKVIEENNKLREAMELKENEIQTLTNDLSQLRSQILVTTDLLDDKRKQQMCDIQQLDELQLEMQVAKETEVNLQKQIHEQNKIKDNLSKKLDEAKEEMDALKELMKERDEAMKTKCLNYEEKLQQSSIAVLEMKECEEKAMNDLRSQHQEELQTLTRSFDSVLSELAMQNENVEKLQLEKQALNERLEHTHLTRDEEIRDLNDTLIKKEQTVKCIEKQIGNLRAQKEQVMLEFERKLKGAEDEITAEKDNRLKSEAEFTETISAFRDREEALLGELQITKEDLLKNQELVKMLEEKLNEMKEENFLLREKSDGHSGARHALQVAYKHTQRQLAQVKGDRDILAQQYHSVRQQSIDVEHDEEVRELKKKVDDLKLRLCIGANAYKEKFVECKKLQNEIRKMMKINAKQSEINGKLNEVMDENVSIESCESRAFIPNKGNTKEVFSLSRSSKIDLNDKREEERTKYTVDTALTFQDKAMKNAALQKIGVNYESSLLKLTAEIKKLQDKNKEKDDLLQKSEDETNQAKAEILRLEDQLAKFQNPEGKFTRFYEQFYASCGGNSLDAESPITAQQHTSSASKNEENQQQASPLKNTTLLQLASDTTKSTTTQPQQATFSQTNQKTTSSNQDSDQYKIFLPPESLKQTPSSSCLTAPYEQTLRPPVLLTQPYNGGQNIATPSGYPYLSDTKKKDVTSTSDVLRSVPVFSCPVCNMIFPSDYSNEAATSHVNSHFPDNPSRAERR